MMPWYLDSDDPEVLKKQRFRRDMAQLLSYLLVVSLFVFYAWNDSREDKERCIQAEEVRQTLRDQVIGTTDFFIGFTVKPEDAPPHTPEEQKEVDAFIDAVNDFRDNQLSQIKPSALCKDTLKEEEGK